MIRTGTLAILLWLLPALQSAVADESTVIERTARDWIADTAAIERQRIDYDGHEFSGPGWDRLLSEGRKAQFFLLGEEHGIAENAKLAAQLFQALAKSGYDTFLIEISPPMARELDDVLAKDGLDGLRRLFAQPGGEPAFFGMAEEAEMLATVRAAVPDGRPVLWGADYEVAGDRTLLRRLAATPKPAAAEAALAALVDASERGWKQHAATGGPQFIFTFTGDPALVRDVERAWPGRDADSAWILDTLEETLEINRLWASGDSFESNRRRAALLRANFLRQWQAARRSGEAPRVMAKFGANHLVRGRNMTQTFDLGSLLPELAAMDGGRSFSIMVVPGKGSPTAVLNPSTWSYEPSTPKDGYNLRLEPITSAALPDAFTLIDLVPLRPIVASKTSEVDDDLRRVVFGFDMLLVMSGSTASTEFEHE